VSDPEKYDAIVIGSGKGGKILATHFGNQNHKVALIERDPMMIGGGCINVACIPTKTFIASARLVHSIRRAADFGIKVEGVSVDWLAVKGRGVACQGSRFGGQVKVSIQWPTAKACGISGRILTDRSDSQIAEDPESLSRRRFLSKVDGLSILN
jgi:pyruvate/2-oxoglutarate dehydrogenase complex dihydrolipoamide dehydrogenase (E3) component